jgi:orotidine-5'-phosphate decarboxylase
MELHERIFVAVDTSDVFAAMQLVRALKDKVGGFKIGLEFITSNFAQLVRDENARDRLDALRELFELIGEDLFWDGKFDDIPNTVAGAALGLVPLSPKFFNVHASATIDAVRQAVLNKGRSKVLAVTVLTSISPETCRYYFGDEPDVIIPRWAEESLLAGVDGFICSPGDLEWLNSDEQLRSVPKMTPGIRPAFSQKGDQSRVMTPAKALEAGVTWMVIGRPITQYPEGPAKAVERILDEMAAAA